MNAHARASLVIAAVLGLFMATVDASGSDASSSLTKEHWNVARTYCPVGCSKQLQKFLNNQVGKPVDISDTQFSAPFLDTCDGRVGMVFNTSNADSVLLDINKGMSPKNVISANDLNLDRGPINTAIVYCDTGDLNLPIATLISVESNRILVLFEQQSIIELR